MSCGQYWGGLSPPPTGRSKMESKANKKRRNKKIHFWIILFPRHTRRLPAAMPRRQGTFQYSVCLSLFYQICRWFARGIKSERSGFVRFSKISFYHFHEVKEGPVSPKCRESPPSFFTALSFLCMPFEIGHPDSLLLSTASHLAGAAGEHAAAPPDAHKTPLF